jgi:hypothetical protein
VLNTSPEWVQTVLGESNGVVFVDTGCTRAKNDDGDDVSNEKEAQILAKLVDTIVEVLLTKFVKKKIILIISIREVLTQRTLV